MSVLVLLFELIISVLYSYSLDKKLINNSNGKFDFDIKELFYYLKTKGALWGAIKVYIAQVIFIFLWRVGLLLMTFLLSFVLGIVMPKTHAALMFSVVASLVCFIVMAIYVVLSYSMAPYVKIENHDMKALACMNESKILMTGNIMKMFFLTLSFIGWFFAAFITLGIAYPFVLAYYNAACVEFYKAIKENSGIYENDNEEVGVFDDVVVEGVVVESDNTFTNGNKKKNHRALYLFLTIVLSLVTFIGMNYLNNKVLIDEIIRTGDIEKVINNRKVSENSDDVLAEIIDRYNHSFNFRLY